ncbi:MAG TPA: BCCT family transporter, partial [Alphaproteobacteria bacterium]|nr:BCCT family transporter [Alphaproteobacteria bacterium]
MSETPVAGAAPRAQMNPPVFFGAAFLIVAIVLFGAVVPDVAATVFSAVQDTIVHFAGWYYMLAVAGFLVFAIGLAFSSYGRIRLGPDDSAPDYGHVTWFAMLFSAGMGIGLMFFGVAEPLLHFSSPPVGQGGTVEAARNAMKITFFHWGLHAWGIYAVIGLSLAYFSFRHGLPLALRSALYPLIGERVHGPIGHAVDIFAVLGTMFGVATSLGLGVMQVNSGLHYLFGVQQATWIQLILIAVITMMATASVVSGLDVGIRRLSELNMILALVILAFVLVTGPTLFLLQALVQNIGAYLGSVVQRTFTLFAYRPSDWMGNWTLFYWGWWMAWSPFVGMFIARVSRGRTIREFVTGVLFVPAGFTFMWMTFFGNTAIALDLGQAAGAPSGEVAQNVPISLFRFFDYLPLSTLASSLATILVVTFFVTSSDSASMVIDIIASGGVEDPPVWQRIFWALTEGVVAAVLLLAGGLTALQTASIAGALPFSLVMIVACLGLLRGLRMEGLRRQSLTFPIPASRQVAGAAVPWQQRLGAIISHPRRERAEAFLHDVVQPALEAVAAEIRERGLDTRVLSNGQEVGLTVFHGDEQEFLYAVRLKAYETPGFA